MRCSASAEGRLALPRAALLGLAVLTWLAPGVAPGLAPAKASEFTVERADIRLVDGIYVLDAHIKFDFSPESLEALENGVPLTVIVDLELVRNRRLFWDKTIVKREARYQLELHALTDRYVLHNVDSGTVRSFRSLDEAMAALGNISGVPVFGSDLLEGNRPYMVRLRARLDIEALPSPLRPLAYLSSLWRLDSDWYTWRIQR